MRMSSTYDASSLAIQIPLWRFDGDVDVSRDVGFEALNARRADVADPPGLLGLRSSLSFSFGFLWRWRGSLDDRQRLREKIFRVMQARAVLARNS